MKISPKSHRQAFLSALVTTVGILAAVLVLENAETQRFLEQQRADALNQLSTVRAHLEGEVNSRLLLVEVLVSYVSVHPDITQDEFVEIAAPLLSRYPGIRSINLAKDSVISHIYPLKGNEQALGLNLGATPQQKQAVERTIASEQSVIAGPVNLVQGGVAFINRSPIFLSSPNEASKDKVYWGLASILVSSDTLYREAGLLRKSAELQYVLRGKDGLGAQGEVFFGDAAIFQHEPVILSVTLPNGSWQLAAIPKGGWLSSAPIILWLRIGGVVLALVAGSSIFIFVSEPVRLQLAVEQATAALTENKSKLKQTNAKMKALNKALSQSESRLSKFLDAIPVGVAVLDAQGKPYYINQKAQKLLGKGVAPEASPEKIAEVYQYYLTGTNQLYPGENLPIIRALKGELTTIDDVEIHAGGKIIPIETWGTPIYDTSGKITYAIAALVDITERKQAEAERQRFTEEMLQLNEAFARFVPRQFLQFLDKKSIVDVQLGEAVQQEMSVLFSDIRDFTTLSESMTPQDNFQFINSYLSRMGPVITEHQGFIDKYIGDGIMALFSGTADNAVRAGIAMLRELAEYNQYCLKHDSYSPIKIGIGINTGLLMLGTVGEQSRMNSTVISDAVNLASRMETLTKKYGVSLLISQHTLGRLQHPMDYNCRFIEQTTVKGKSKAVAVFEVFDGDESEMKQKKLATKRVFEEGLFLYYKQAFLKAAQRFTKVLSINSQDKVSQIYLERCQLQIRKSQSSTSRPSYC
ncbi:MAG: PAS domain S-box protein [Symploca sp. SIO2C1]|nr:PAS domain S-box protein [Symploca sp. SIO2C1]